MSIYVYLSTNLYLQIAIPNDLRIPYIIAHIIIIIWSSLTTEYLIQKALIFKISASNLFAVAVTWSQRIQKMNTGGLVQILRHVNNVATPWKWRQWQVVFRICRFFFLRCISVFLLGSGSKDSRIKSIEVCKPPCEDNQKPCIYRAISSTGVFSEFQGLRSSSILAHLPYI